MNDFALNGYLLIWARKPVLRAIYVDYYRRIKFKCMLGLSLEIGGDSGNFKEFSTDVITTDIQFAPWLDFVADALALPFADGSFENIVGVDDLHYIEYPSLFLTEAERVLKPGGRLIFLEPAITPVSWFFYKFLHQESVLMDADPLLSGNVPDPDRDPFDANIGIPTLLVGRHRKQLRESSPKLKLFYREHLSSIAYLMSGEFKRWRLIPLISLRFLLKMEQAFSPFIGRLMGFRLLIVFEKSSSCLVLKIKNNIFVFLRRALERQALQIT